jgi:hypothetical protein
MDRILMGKAFMAHRDFNTKDREKMAAKGHAMPDGSFPIRTRDDLKNAIRLVGMAKNKAAAKAHIIKRARALGLTELLPEDWVGEAAQAMTFEEFLEHHGVKGMRWGVRRSRSQLARESKSRTGKDIKDLSDDELRKLVTRMNLEQQYKSLSSRHNKTFVKAGAAFVGGVALNAVKQQLTNQAQAGMNKAIASALAKKAAKKAAGG